MFNLLGDLLWPTEREQNGVTLSTWIRNRHGIFLLAFLRLCHQQEKASRQTRPRFILGARINVNHEAELLQPETQGQQQVVVVISLFLLMDLLCRLYSSNGYLMQSSRLTLHVISIPLFLFFHLKKIIYCEKGATEDEMVGWHNHLNGHEFEQTPGNREQRSPGCCSPWGHKESGMTERLNENNLLFI